MLTGTIVNALAVLAGSVAGLFLTWLARHFSRYLPANSAALGERLQTIIMQGVALCVLFLGISGSLKGQNSLITILAMVIGAMIPSMVTLTLGATVDINGAQVVLQEIIDQICPFILPLGLVGGCYSLLKKGKSGTAVMFGLLVLGIVLVALGLV